MTMRHRLRWIAPILVALAACAEPPNVGKPRDQMGQRERDSTIAASSLPGSGVVRKGLDMSDVGEKRAAMFDSAGAEN
ncbi:MAG: hypothetical protein ABI681_07785 [Gemmatimonadales bacterium]